MGKISACSVTHFLKVVGFGSMSRGIGVVFVAGGVTFIGVEHIVKGGIRVIKSSFAHRNELSVINKETVEEKADQGVEKEIVVINTDNPFARDQTTAEQEMVDEVEKELSRQKVDVPAEKVRLSVEGTGGSLGNADVDATGNKIMLRVRRLSELL